VIWKGKKSKLEVKKYRTVCASNIFGES
jgi:hypothetical protein